MGKCKSFRYLIITNYIDGYIDQPTKCRIEDHLRTCANCRQFMQEAQQKLVAPFQGLKKEPLPPEVWFAIKQQIENKRSWKDRIMDWGHGLLGDFSIWRPVPIICSLLMAFLVGSYVLTDIQIKQAKEMEQADYLITLVGHTSESIEAKGGWKKNPIEDYFL